MWVYKAAIIIWITFGLGYLLMILGFISKGMTHKNVRVVINRPLSTVRSTKQRLARDVDYMRNVVSELYLMKIKPMYELDGSEGEVGTGDGLQPNDLKRRRHSSFPSLVSRSRQPSMASSMLARNISESVLKSMSLNFNEVAGDHWSVPSSKNSGTATPPTSMLARNISDSILKNLNQFEKAEKRNVSKDNSALSDDLLDAVVHALNIQVMTDVIDAVDELNDYEDRWVRHMG
jgi:hypothetical protein